MLPYPDPLSPPVKDNPTPQSGTPAAPATEPAKKPEKKLETPVIVAIISAIVTLITSILGSPVLVNLVNKANQPAPTATTVLAISQNSLLPVVLSGDESLQSTIAPTEFGANIIKFTPTPQAANLTSPLLVTTVTPTILSTQEQDPPTSKPPSFFQCLATDVWFPYPTSLTPEASNGCWNLADWGFSTDQGRLLLVHNPGQDQERGIYTPIRGDVDIRFTLQLDKFRTRSNKVGFLNFGIVQNEPFTIYTGGFLSYQQPAPGPSSPVRVLISGTNQATQRISDLEAGFQHEILLSIKDDRLVVYINGKQAGDPVKLPAKDRAFWIGYVLPSKSELDMKVTNFSIQSQ